MLRCEVAQTVIFVRLFARGAFALIGSGATAGKPSASAAACTACGILEFTMAKTEFDPEYCIMPSHKSSGLALSPSSWAGVRPAHPSGASVAMAAAAAATHRSAPNG